MAEAIKDPQWVGEFVPPADLDAGQLLKTIDHTPAAPPG
jgi:hypothetical protein